MSSEKRDWSKSENEQVSVSGTAQNAKAGALLMIGGEHPILLQGVSDWDEETVGKEVKVEAIVRRMPGFPEAEDTDEEIQGTATGRDIWVLEVKHYHVLD